MPQNLVRGLPATFDPAPNYQYCTDPDDKWQLTDGQSAARDGQTSVEHPTKLWVQKSTVGWVNSRPLTISFDLGKIQPISGISFSTAAGDAGASWPQRIFIGVSDDNATWHYCGDLVALSNATAAPPSEGYAVWSYATHALHAHGRYVALIVLAHPTAFCDEIEVYRGAEGDLATAQSALPERGLHQVAANLVFRDLLATRISDDLNGVRAELAGDSVPQYLKRQVEPQLDALAPSCQLPAQRLPDWSTFRAVVPYNDIDARILAIHGQIVGASHPPMVLWQQHRYQWLPLLAMPPRRPAAPVLDLAMLKDEVRSDDLLLTNASPRPQTATLRVEGLAPGQADALQVAAMPWTDTTLEGWGSSTGIASNRPVAAALPLITPGPAGYAFLTPAGVTTKLWFSVDSHRLAPGEYQLDVEISCNGENSEVPLHIHVSRVAMLRPQLSLGMYDYTDNADGAYGITAANAPAVIALMRSHCVDTVWAAGQTLPRSTAESFDAANNLKKPLDWSAFDAWLAKWPDARHHFYAAPGLGKAFVGTQVGDPEFTARVGSWARALWQGLEQRKLAHGDFAICLMDEPRTDEDVRVLAAWEDAIKAAAPGITLFEDPNWMRPDQVVPQDVFTRPDVLCPNLAFYHQGGAPVERYFQQRIEAGQTLWFYQCHGPTRTFDPTIFFRLQAWQAFAHGAKGEQYWSIGDIGTTPTSWDEYVTNRPSYSPLFLDANTAMDGIGWETVREGVEDYEYLAMLRDRISISTNHAWKSNAQRLLDTAVATVTADYVPDAAWKSSSRVGQADEYRLEILRQLELAG